MDQDQNVNTSIKSAYKLKYTTSYLKAVVMLALNIYKHFRDIRRRNMYDLGR